jgi:hypothetical protein
MFRKEFLKKTPEEIRQIEELRRSNASKPHANKARYSRKVKHKDRTDFDSPQY